MGISITLIAKIRFEEGYCETEPETEADTKKESQRQRGKYREREPEA